jgi:hypothetical protein
VDILDLQLVICCKRYIISTNIASLTNSNTKLKTNGPNSLSKDALREEGCPWLKYNTAQVHSGDVGLNNKIN